MKRLASLLFASIFSISLLCGCQEKQEYVVTTYELVMSEIKTTSYKESDSIFKILSENWSDEGLYFLVGTTEQTDLKAKQHFETACKIANSRVTLSSGYMVVSVAYKRKNGESGILCSEKFGN